MRLALLYLLTLFILSLVGASRGHFRLEHLNALAQFFGSNLAYVALLYMVIRVKEGYIEARLDAYTDSLTGLRNRRYLDLVLDRELSRSHRYGRPLSLLILDLDNFKRVNDVYGHPVGDRVLKTLAHCLEEHLGLSVSIGVTQAQPEDSALSFLKRADEALYQAKRRGKNRVEVG